MLGDILGLLGITTGKNTCGLRGATREHYGRVGMTLESQAYLWANMVTRDELGWLGITKADWGLPGMNRYYQQPPEIFKHDQGSLRKLTAH